MRLLRPSVCAAILLLTTAAVWDQATAARTSDGCVLPADLQQELVTEYPTLRPVKLSDLEEDDRKYFQADHDNSCPGMVKVDFYGDGKPTLALVLIPNSSATETSRLVVAHNPRQTWEITVLDTGGPGVYPPVVWSQPPSKYRDVYGDKTIQATKPVIVFCKYESWAILYAWTGRRVSKIWLQD